MSFEQKQFTLEVILGELEKLDRYFKAKEVEQLESQSIFSAILTV
jgi:hypothetical protein